MAQLFNLRQLSKGNFSLFHMLWQRDIRKFSQCQLNQQMRKKEDDALQTFPARESGGHQVSTDVREKIKENTKTFSYTAIIVAGVGVTAVMFWAIFRELFSSCSPNNIYSDALERVIQNYQVQDAIGAPIKGYGEESRRGRRQHVAHIAFERNGVPHIRMKFYVQGLRNKATVHLESRKNLSGQMEYRYLFVQLDHYPNTTIILEDNRAFDPLPSAASLNANINESNISLASFDGRK